MSAAIWISLLLRRKYTLPVWLSVSSTTLVYWSQAKSASVERKFAAARSIELSTASRFCACAPATNNMPRTAARTILRRDFIPLLRCPARRERLLPGPYFIRRHPARYARVTRPRPGTAHRLPPHHLDIRVRYRCDGPLRALTHRPIALATHLGRIDLVHQQPFFFRKNDYSGLMRAAVNRFVVEVDPDRRNEHKSEDERDHHVVMQAAALIFPRDVS